ncbi:MAG TPA: glycosyltransferase [Nitrolancea sp.]|nr:glycosyltransferase [Nitrolancea sp.]
MKPKVSALWRPIWAKRAGDFQESKSSIDVPEHERAQIAEQQRLLAERLKTLSRTPPSTFKGQGIVMAIGGRHVAGGWATLSILRQVHHCRLPIEIWHLGDRDLPPSVRSLFDEFDVEFVDASHDRRLAQFRPTTGWELKSVAISLSRFAEVIYLDADNVPLVDPGSLFDDPRYRSTGALFWPDIRNANRFNPIWSITGTTAPEGPEFESGLIVVDKLRHWPELQLTMHFNEHSHFYYRYLLGDKDTFQLAWTRLNGRFALPRKLPEQVFGTHFGNSSGPLALIGVWQHDFNGARITLHHTDTPLVAWGRNPTHPEFKLSGHRDVALAELRRRWDGYFEAPPKPKLNSNLPAEIESIRWYRYIIQGIECRDLEFLTDGHIGSGALRAERFWRLDGSDADRRLIISSREHDTCELRMRDDGSWVGQWTQFQQSPVELIPLAGLHHDATEAEIDPRPKLLYVTPVAPAELGNGLAMRAANVLRLLLETHRVTVLVIPLYHRGAATTLPTWMEAFCEDIRTAQPPMTYTRENVPDRDVEQWERAWIEEIGRAYDDQSFDVIHIFRMFTLKYAQRYLDSATNQPATLQLDLDDVESRTQQRLARLYSRHRLDAGRTEALRMATWAEVTERQLMNSWDRVFVCSAEDKVELDARVPTHRAEIVVLPNRVMLPVDLPPPPRGTPLTLLCVGTLSYFPNADGVIWFCREVLPVIRELSAVQLRLLVVGTGATDEVRDLAHIPEVEIVGEVERVDEWYQQADLVIVPLRAGGGTRIKLIEAMAYQRPIVSTSIAAEGLAVTDGIHLLIGDRPVVFARHCLRLLQDASLANKLAANGRKLVEERYALREIEVKATLAR